MNGPHTGPAVARRHRWAAGRPGVGRAPRATEPLCETSPVFEGVPLVAGLAAATYAAWRSYVAARSALLPLIRQGDTTRTLIDATRPVYSRTRVRMAVRNLALSLVWLTVAMYGLFLASAGMAMQGIAVTHR